MAVDSWHARNVAKEACRRRWKARNNAPEAGVVTLKYCAVKAWNGDDGGAVFEVRLPLE